MKTITLEDGNKITSLENVAAARKEIKAGRAIVCLAMVGGQYFLPTYVTFLDALISAKQSLHNQRIGNLALKSTITYWSLSTDVRKTTEQLKEEENQKIVDTIKKYRDKVKDLDLFSDNGKFSPFEIQAMDNLPYTKQSVDFLYNILTKLEDRRSARISNMQIEEREAAIRREERYDRAVDKYHEEYNRWRAGAGYPRPSYPQY